MEAVVNAVANFLSKIFGNANQRALKRYWKVVLEEINPLEEKMKALRDEEFRDLTARLRERLAKGETLEEVLPEAFAACREASLRTTKMRHFDVQMIGGMVLHEGNVAEMTTGEGKTLVATSAAYLNALAGKGVHIVTVNDYLARRDTQWMGPIYHLLGATVGVIQHEESFLYDADFHPEDARLDRLRPSTRREAYAADITYGTNNEFGFDYLRDHMKLRAEDQVQRGHEYAIVDEVDSILIDEARTPLIISGPAHEHVDKYMIADRVARMLKRDEDFEVKEKEHMVILSERGASKAEKLVGVDNFYTGENMDWPHYIETALKAHNLYKRDQDYTIKEGEVVIVDEFTGRMMPGRRWSDGLHQAVEAKEAVRVREESQTYATVTLQNYFNMYGKKAGMTGTAATEAVELHKIYDLEVLVVPTNKTLIRTTTPDAVFGTEREKFDAVEEAIVEIHKTGRPVLVGTTSIEKSEVLSERLRMRGVKHEVLNAKHHEREAPIVAQAGQPSAVTIATNMAGRGTDILLGEGVPALGGLHIIGTERHEARRIDNQLRGRAGRQGDPGSSQFFLSLEDDLFRKFSPPWVRAAIVKLGLSEGERIESRMVSRSIEKAQKNVEARNFEIRKNLLEYDKVRNEQRKIIYGMRQQILEGQDVHERVLDMVRGRAGTAVDRFVREAKEEPDFAGLAAWANAQYDLALGEGDVRSGDADDVEEKIVKAAMERYARREEELGRDALREMERLILLDRIDDKWKDLLYNMDNLRDIIGLRGYAQLDPKLQYKKEATELFEEMMAAIEDEVSRLIFRVVPQAVQLERMARRWRATQFRKDEVAQFAGGDEGGGDGAEAKPEPIRAGPKIKRNQPCPCGSGKKYKRCCGVNAAT